MLNKVTLTVISMHAAFMVQAMPAGHALMDGNGIGGGHRRNIFSARPAGAPGLDVSRWEGPVDMAAQRDRGAAFVFVRATEGASTVDPTFEDHWPAARAAGLFRSAYHYAMPDRSSGDQQARFFLAHGGSGNASLAAAAVAQRKADQHQRVLPGMLDIEYNNETSRDACYGMRGQRMVNWIRAFVGTYHRATGAWPIIYTTREWWQKCTHDCRHFSHHCSLFLANYDRGLQPLVQGEAQQQQQHKPQLRDGDLFGGWTNWTFWQWASSGGAFDGDQDVFRGQLGDLARLAIC